MAGMLQANEVIIETEDNLGTEMFRYVNNETARVDGRQKSSRNKVFNKINREVTAEAIKADSTKNDGGIIYGPNSSVYGVNDEIFCDPHDADIVLRGLRGNLPEKVTKPMSNLDKAQLSNRELTRKLPTAATTAKADHSFAVKDPDFCNLLETISTPRDPTDSIDNEEDTDMNDDESYYSRLNKRRGIFEELSLVEKGQKSFKEIADIQ